MNNTYLDSRYSSRAPRNFSTAIEHCDDNCRFCTSPLHAALVAIETNLGEEIILKLSCSVLNLLFLNRKADIMIPYIYCIC